MAVILEVKDYIATVTVDRPPANAVDKAQYEDITTVFDEINDRDDVKVVVFTAKGKCFMAGNERADFGIWTDYMECRKHYARMADSFYAVRNCKYPVIGAINGHAMGAGYAYAGCCDVLVAKKGVRFEMSEMNVGVLGADHYSLSLMPENMARYYAYTGTSVMSEDLERFGSVLKTYDTEEETLEGAYEVARLMCKQSRISLVYWKELLSYTYPHPIKEPTTRAGELMKEFRKHHDFTEANHAFLEKRSPEYDNK